MRQILRFGRDALLAEERGQARPIIHGQLFEGGFIAVAGSVRESGGGDSEGVHPFRSFHGREAALRRLPMACRSEAPART